MLDVEQARAEMTASETDYGWEWHATFVNAMTMAETKIERVVIQCGKKEIAPWATVWKAQPLARFLTRGAQVVWQGNGLHGDHWML